MINSVWSDTVSIPKKRSMSQDMQTDVLIIGGGMPSTKQTAKAASDTSANCRSVRLIFAGSCG